MKLHTVFIYTRTYTSCDPLIALTVDVHTCNG